MARISSGPVLQRDRRDATRIRSRLAGNVRLSLLGAIPNQEAASDPSRLPASLAFLRALGSAHSRYLQTSRRLEATMRARYSSCSIGRCPGGDLVKVSVRRDVYWLYWAAVCGGLSVGSIPAVPTASVLGPALVVNGHFVCGGEEVVKGGVLRFCGPYRECRDRRCIDQGYVAHIGMGIEERCR